MLLHHRYANELRIRYTPWDSQGELESSKLIWTGAVQSMLSATSDSKDIQGSSDEVEAVEMEIEQVQSNMDLCVRMCDPRILCSCAL